MWVTREFGLYLCSWDGSITVLNTRRYCAENMYTVQYTRLSLVFYEPLVIRSKNNSTKIITLCKFCTLLRIFLCTRH